METLENNVIDLSNNEDATIWSSRNEEIFINIMEEETLKGNRSTTTFAKSAWRRIRDKMWDQTKRSYSEVQLKNKFNILKAKQRNFKVLLQQTGIGYSSVNGQVTATEDVWDKLSRVYRFAKLFKKKGCPFYDKLCTIFADTTATGSNSHPSINDPSDEEEDDEEQSKSTTRKHDNLDDEVESGKDTFPSKKRSSASTKLSFTLRQFSEVSEKKLELMERTMTFQGSASEGSRFNLLKESVSALDKIEGISGDLYSKAIEKFHDGVWRALFLEMPENRRKDWVLSLDR